MTSFIPEAAAGFKNASAYDAHRPSYVPEAVDGLLTKLGVKGKTNAKIIDLAAGTGKFTEVLAAREEKYQITAVEPVESMREALVAKELAGVDVKEGVADKMDVVDGAADALVAAQSFHWFANDASLEEIRRVLKPNGSLGMIWNIEDYNQPRAWTASAPWETKLKQLILDLPLSGPPRFREDQWWKIFDQGQKFFSVPIESQQVPYTIWLTREALWSRVNTLSQVSILEGGDKEAVIKKFNEFLDGEGTIWNEKKEVAVHVNVYYAWTKRL